jgi:hypothetical protein
MDWRVILVVRDAWKSAMTIKAVKDHTHATVLPAIDATL